MVQGGCARLLGSYIPERILRRSPWTSFHLVSLTPSSVFLKLQHADGSGLANAGSDWDRAVGSAFLVSSESSKVRRPCSL